MSFFQRYDVNAALYVGVGVVGLGSLGVGFAASLGASMLSMSASVGGVCALGATFCCPVLTPLIALISLVGLLPFPYVQDLAKLLTALLCLIAVVASAVVGAALLQCAAMPMVFCALLGTGSCMLGAFLAVDAIGLLGDVLTQGFWVFIDEVAHAVDEGCFWLGETLSDLASPSFDFGL